MDLERLKIDEKHRPADGGSRLRSLCIGVAIFAGGFAAGWFLHSFPFSATAVDTVVVKPPETRESARFTAGGWIEAKTPEYPLIVSSRVAERIEKIFVTDGQFVEPGQELVRIYDKDFRVKLELASAQKNTAERNLELLRSGFRDEDIRNAEAKLQEAEEKLRIAKANYERTDKLHAKNAISDREFDNTLAAFRQAEAFCRAASTEYEKYKKGHRAEEIAIAQSQYEEAESELELARLNLEYCVIRAPDSAGPLRVLKVLRKQGEMVNPDKENTDLLSLYDPKEMQVRVDVPQANVKYIVPGGRALIRTDAIPGKEYAGTVLRAEPMAELAKNTITARVKVDEPDNMLFPEMVAKVTFLDAQTSKPGASAEAGVRIPAAAIGRDSAGEHVFVVRDGRAVRQTVKSVPAEPGSETIAVEGLASGQRVITSGLSSLKDGQKIREKDNASSR